MKHLIVRSRNTSCKPLKEIEVPITTIYRMGSVTPTNRILRNPNRKHLEINSPEACAISGNKIKMKEKFIEAGVHTAQFQIFNDKNQADSYFQDMEYDIIAKKYNSSKGNGIYMIRSYEDYKDFVKDKNISDYIFEKYYTYSREYRVHVSKLGCFYASRKMLINNAEERWHRHGNNSVFINETNPAFSRPETWDLIVADCIKAMNQIGLDIAAFDVKVNRKGDFILLESNSAPSLKEFGIEKYKKELLKIIDLKIINGY